MQNVLSKSTTIKNIGVQTRRRDPPCPILGGWPTRRTILVGRCDVVGSTLAFGTTRCVHQIHS